jgi:CRP-like cAMP-binding protein
MLDRLAASMRKFGKFSPDHLSQILYRLHTLQVKKGDYLVKEKQVCESCYFFCGGGFSHFQLDKKGEETTLNLFVKNEWLFEYKSFMTQQPSENFIQAVCDGELFGLTVVDFYELIKFSETFFWPGSIFESATQNHDCQYTRLSLKERYELLLATKPEVLQYFRLKYIASYLGMTPETLSRLRKKIRSQG